MPNPAIKVENISKQYRLGNIGTGSLSNDLKRWWHQARGKEDPFLRIGEANDRATKGESEYVWALKNINFEVMPGEILGIIGKNGAGKSTLLKILSKVTGPTTGSIRYNGRIGSLLEVGTGFHPELTGRENIFLNGAILGMTKAEIRLKLDEIIDFSGCERYIDTPVKRYSSGMLVRLGFAVAAHLEPEILVVDEVLAVGDAEFQKKAIGKMQDVSRSEGRTVLFVSHNMGAVNNLCSQGIIIERGAISHYGKIRDVIQKYLTSGSTKQVHYPQNNQVQSIELINENNSINIILKYEGERIIKKPNLGFVVYDNLDNPLFGTNATSLGDEFLEIPKKKGIVKVVISSPYLSDGSYPVSIWFSDGVQMSEEDTIYQAEKCLCLEVDDMNKLYIQKNIAAEGPIVPVVRYEYSV